MKEKREKNSADKKERREKRERERRGGEWRTESKRERERLFGEAEAGSLSVCTKPQREKGRQSQRERTHRKTGTRKKDKTGGQAGTGPRTSRRRGRHRRTNPLAKDLWSLVSHSAAAGEGRLGGERGTGNGECACGSSLPATIRVIRVRHSCDSCQHPAKHPFSSRVGIPSPLHCVPRLNVALTVPRVLRPYLAPTCIACRLRPRPRPSLLYTRLHFPAIVQSFLLGHIDRYPET